MVFTLNHSRPGSTGSGEALVAPSSPMAYRNGRKYSAAPSTSSKASSFPAMNTQANILAQLDEEPLEEWEKKVNEKEHMNPWSARGWMNMGTIFVLCGGIISVFLVLPVAREVNRKLQTSGTSGYNLGGINSTGQVTSLQRELIDADTPPEAYSRTGYDGKNWNLVFSDEFETDGRTFFPGDDPFFEGVDLHYWGTNDFEWYDPSAITTRDGKLVITLTQEPIHNLNFKSGMLQSWNKLCFSGSMYYEVSLILPGNHKTGGFWPGVWAFGNLGRAGYGASTEGTWPYSYDSCDVGILPNQTYINGTGPYDALHSPQDGTLSYLPGQRWSSCTCQGEDHPGPDVSVGRGVPEVDLIEAQVVIDSQRGQVSQTLQLAPYDSNWQFNQNYSEVYDSDNTYWNTYTGGTGQQSASGLTYVGNDVYTETGARSAVYSYEMYANKDDRENGYITWMADGKKAWTLHADGLAANSGTEVGRRLIPEEPMSLVFNFGMSNNFQLVDFTHLNFPNEMLFEYVRIYQREDFGTVGCDPADYPTADYIANHPKAYTDPNITTWAQTGYSLPKNRLVNGCV